MTASIREIAKNANDAADVAASAVRVADQTNATAVSYTHLDVYKRQ